MKFVGLVGANYDQSYNRKLLEFIRRHFKIKFELEVLEIDEVPMFNQDEKWDESFQLRLLNNKITRADGVIIAKPGDCFMGMSLDAGGHLSHGMHLNFSGKYFRCVPYGLNADEDIDYEEVERLAKENKPKIIICGASAFSLRIDFKRFADIAHSVGAYLMVDMAHYAGIIAAGVYPSPFPYADIVTTTTHKTLRGPRGGVIFCKPELEKKINSAVFPGIQGGPLMHVIAAKAIALGEALTPEYKAWGAQVVKNAAAMADELTKKGLRIVSGRTESHVMLVDLRPKHITGKAAQALLESGHMTANKNAIPNDPEKPFVTSGIRLGSSSRFNSNLCFRLRS